MSSADTPESLSSTTGVPEGAPGAEAPGVETVEKDAPAGAGSDATVGAGSDATVGAGSDATVGADAVDNTARRRKRRKWWGIGIAAALLVGAVLGFLFVPTPYVLIQPGAVRPAEERVEISGADSYDSDGDIMFTTVYVDQATLFGLMRGSFDDAIEVRTETEVYGDRGRDETREVNRQQMDLSKLIATMEALTLLGYESEFSAEGAHVLDVADDAPAADDLEAGDVIVAVDGNEVRLPAGLREGLSGYAAGDEVTLTVQRPVAPSGESAASSAGEMESVEITTTLTESGGGDPDATDGEVVPESRAVLGVSVEPWNPTVEGEVDVDIDSGSVTGPSAGLAWALAVVDTLTPESLTDGRDVAVTGEILADGSIGVIGGIEQKVSTVSRNGVEVFIYPADTPEAEQQEMRRVAGDKVELVPVANLTEAVEYLSPGLISDGD